MSRILINMKSVTNIFLVFEDFLIFLAFKVFLLLNEI